MYNLRLGGMWETNSSSSHQIAIAPGWKGPGELVLPKSVVLQLRPFHDGETIEDLQGRLDYLFAVIWERCGIGADTGFQLGFLVANSLWSHGINVSLGDRNPDWVFTTLDGNSEDDWTRFIQDLGDDPALLDSYLYSPFTHIAISNQCDYSNFVTGGDYTKVYYV